IPLSDLPPTFRDAIAVTRTLRVRYLWIDSLCIIQDDRDDWAKESPKMGLIYTNAILTIAASAARDSSCGLFSHRTGADGADLVSTAVPFYDSSRGGRAGSFHLRIPDSY